MDAISIAFLALAFVWSVVLLVGWLMWRRHERIAEIEARASERNRLMWKARHGGGATL